MIRWEKIAYPFYKGKSKKEWEIRNKKFLNFVEYFGFDCMSDIRTVGSFEKLLNGERSYNNTSNLHYGYNPEKFPDRDHSMVFKIKGTKKIVFVNQPYKYNLQRLKTWCNERNLIYVICHDENSFYYPGHSNMILVMSNDTYIDFLELTEFPSVWEENIGEMECL